MVEKPQYLKNEDIVDFMKDTCLFCNERMGTKHRTRTHTYTRTADHYYDYECTDTNTTFYVTDIDVNLFTFRFEKDDKERILETRKAVYERMAAEIRDRATHVRGELESKLTLPDDQKQTATDAIVGKVLADLQSPWLGWPHCHRELSPLDKRLDRWYHNLFFGDLEMIWGPEYHVVTNQRNHNTYFKPKEIKSHAACWPFGPVRVAAEAPMRVPYKKFLDAVQQNSRFADYEKRLEEIPDVYAFAKKTSLIISAKRYNPAELL